MPKISELTAASSLSTSDTLPVVQSGTTKRSTVSQVASAIAPAWTSYTPDIVAYSVPLTPGTDPTMGNTVRSQCRYIQVGSIVKVKYRFVIGSTFSAGSGFYFIEAPVQPYWSPATVGHGEAIRSSDSGQTYLYSVKVDPGWIASATPLLGPLMMPNASNFDGITQAAPFAWAENDILVGMVEYEAEL